jgi:hypothetical protein
MYAMDGLNYGIGTYRTEQLICWHRQYLPAGVYIIKVKNKKTVEVGNNN